MFRPLVPKISLNLFDNVKRGNAHLYALGDGVTGPLKGWRHRIRRKGGFWTAEGFLEVGLEKGQVSRAMVEEMYLEGLHRRIIETVGANVYWDGFVGELTLTLDGQTYVRSLLPSANAVKTLFSRKNPNLFSDGSAESAAWTAVGTPSTHERSTYWVTNGTYGMHVVTDAADEGTQIEAGLTIEAGWAYFCRVSVNIVSGTWTLAVHQSTDDEVLASRSTSDTGINQLVVTISDDNEYAGDTYVRLTADAASAELYADNARYAKSPYPVETAWQTDADSAEEYGRIEDILLEGDMWPAAATALAKTHLKARAWPRSLPPPKDTLDPEQREQPDQLEIFFLGYIWTLNNKHIVTSGGQDTASALITAALGEAEYVTAGYVKTNTLATVLEDDHPIRCWDAIEEIVDQGDASGNRYTAGVYQNRLFFYDSASTTPEYHIRGGRLLDLSNAPVPPWEARPGLAHVDDLPVGPAQLGSDETDDPRNVYLEEIEYIAPSRLSYSREKTEVE